MTENMKYHIDGKKPLIENTFRYGSKAFLDLWAEARYLYSRDVIDLSGMDKEIILETHLGEYGLYEGKKVPLDLPMVEETTLLPTLTESTLKHLVSKTIKETVVGTDIDLSGTVTTKKKYAGYYDVFVDGKPAGYVMQSEDGKFWSAYDLDDQPIDSGTKSFVLNAFGVKKKTAKKYFSIFSKVTGDIAIGKVFNSEKQAKDYLSNSNFPKAFIDTLEIRANKSLNEAEYQGKKVEIGKPKRGGSKKFYVYVIDPKSKKVKKVSFGAAGGGQNLAVKIRDPKARKAFAARQNCDQKKDKTKPGYWSCNIGRYWKSLGGGSNFSGYW